MFPGIKNAHHKKTWENIKTREILTACMREKEERMKNEL